MLAIGSAAIHEAVVDYKDGVSNKQLPASLYTFIDTAGLQTIINGIAQGTTLDRSYTSAFERVRDNVFCSGNQCGDRSDAPNVVLFFTAGQPTVRVVDAQATVNYVKARSDRPAFIITIGVGPPQVQSLISPALTDFATCSVNAFFSTAGSLQGILTSVYDKIAHGAPGPVFNSVSGVLNL